MTDFPLQLYTMKQSFTICFLILLFTCSCSIFKGKSLAFIDQSDPVKVMKGIFEAVNRQDFGVLVSLCAPDGKGDGDTKDICGLQESDAKTQAEFTDYFKGAKVTNSRIVGNEAQVEFLFGPNTSKKETMNLEKIDGIWYLRSY